MRITKAERKKLIKKNLEFALFYVRDVKDVTFNKKRCLIAIDDAIKELK